MARLLGAAILALCYFSPTPEARQVASPGRALKIEDYYRIETIGNYSISPDGRRVVFTVTTRLEEPDANSSRISTFVVPTAGTSEPTRFLHHDKEVSNPTWTDDGLLEYTADGKRWRFDPDDRKAPEQVQSSASTSGRGGGRGGGQNPVRSPDGKWEALAVNKPQTTVPPVYASDFEKRHQERFKGVTFDWKDFQRDGAEFPAPNPAALPPQTITLRPRTDQSGATGGANAQTLLDNLDLRPSNIAWHPNGRLLAFTADPEWRDELKYTSPDLWTVSIDGKVERLTNDTYVYGDVSFSPDGKYLSYSRSLGTDMIIDKKLNHGGPDDLYIRPVSGGEPINLTAKWDLDPGPARWSPDSRFLYFTAAIGGESHLFRVSAPDARVEQITHGPRRLNGVVFDRSFTRIVYTVGQHNAPAELFIANIDGSSERRLTTVHKGLLSEIALSGAERLQWPSRDGTPIEGWLLRPHGYDQAKGPYPLIVISHGGPHAATGYTFDFKQQYFAANGFFVLDTNFRGSTGYGTAFKWATWGAWGDKDGEDVVSGIDYVLKRYPIDPKRVGHTGHSYGGFMTNWLITQYPDRFAAAISGAGISNWISDYGTADIYRTKETEFFGTPWDKAARDRMIRQSPLTYAGQVKTPTLFVHGEVDQRVPYEEAEQMYFALKRRGIPARMIRYAGQAHGISGNWNVVHRMLNELQWWEKHLKRCACEGNPPLPQW